MLHHNSTLNSLLQITRSTPKSFLRKVDAGLGPKQRSSAPIKDAQQ